MKKSPAAIFGASFSRPSPTFALMPAAHLLGMTFEGFNREVAMVRSSRFRLASDGASRARR